MLLIQQLNVPTPDLDDQPFSTTKIAKVAACRRWSIHILPLGILIPHLTKRHELNALLLPSSKTTKPSAFEHLLAMADNHAVTAKQEHIQI